MGQRDCNREPSTSVTNLVKQIADERISLQLSNLKREMKEYISEQVDVISSEHTDFVNKSCENLVSTMENSCAIWKKDEEDQLMQELRTAIAFIAKQHGRSMNAIVCRISDKDLLKEARQ